MASAKLPAEMHHGLRMAWGALSVSSQVRIVLEAHPFVESRTMTLVSRYSAQCSMQDVKVNLTLRLAF
jgi:hypothetical protein